MTQKIYTNCDGESMRDWRKKYNILFNLKRLTNQVLFVNKFKNLLEPLRILEYGCAFGEYLNILRTINHKHELYGVEIVKEPAEQAKIEVPGIRIFNQSCGDPIKLEGGFFDIIVSFDMIEHISNKKILKKMYLEANRLLKEDGVFILVTPNCNLVMKWIYILTGNDYIIDKGFHPNIYTKNKLRNEVEPFSDIFSVERGYDLNFFKRILSWFGIYKHICLIAKKKK